MLTSNLLTAPRFSLMHFVENVYTSYLLAAATGYAFFPVTKNYDSYEQLLVTLFDSTFPVSFTKCEHGDYRTEWLAKMRQRNRCRLAVTGSSSYVVTVGKDRCIAGCFANYLGVIF